MNNFYSWLSINPYQNSYISGKPNVGRTIRINYVIAGALMYARV